MPLSPSECRTRRRKNLRPAFEMHCDRIDEMVLGSSGPEHWFDIRGIEPDVVAQIVSTYAALGWDVSRISDQRDGDALVFKERK